MSQPRETSIEVEVIDNEKFCAKIRENMTDMLKPEEGIKLWCSYGIVRTSTGTYLLDNDGTGNSDPIEKTPSEVGITRSAGLYCAPQWTLGITKDMLDTLPVTGKVNLALFIRKFGSRLEENFRQWNNFLTQQVNKQT